MAFMLPAFFSKIGAFIVGNWAKIKAAAFIATLAVGVKGYRQAQDMLAQSQAILANKTAAGGKIPVVYGTRRVGAQILYMDVSNNDSRHLFVVYALSVGECDEILGRTIELDGNPLTDSARFKYGSYIGSDKISSGSGSLNTVSQVGSTISAGAGQFGTSPTSRYRITLNLHHGASSQTADPMLVASMPNWTTAHKLNGVAYIAAHYKYDKEGMFSGIPQLTVQVRGKKVYDPRSGETAFTDSTGKVIGDNPALCFLDYITNDEYGKGLTTSQINMTTFGAAATVCETQVDQPYFNGTAKSLTWSGTAGDDFITIGGSSANEEWYQNKIAELIDLFDANGNNVLDGLEIKDIQRTNYFGSTENFRIFFNGTLGSTYSPQTGTSLLKVKRFHCNGYLDTNKNVMENAKELLSNMRGIFLYINGQYELSIEDTGTSSFSINDNHIIADAGISVDYGNKDKKANKVIVEFFNANKKYELDTATVLHDASPEYYSDDGDEILEIKAEFPYISDPYIAYNMGKAILTRSRNQTTMQFLGTPEMYKLNVGDIVDLTYAGLGFSGKVCRVEALELQPNGLVAVSLIEYFDVYTWEVPPQEPVEELANLPSAYAVKPPTNITFTDTDSSSTGRPFLSWDEPTDFPDYQYRVNVVDNSGNQVINRIVDVENCDLNFLPVNANYVASVTSLNTLGTESSAATLTFTIGDAPTATADIQDDAIVTNKILDGSVTDAKINSITANKITAGTIDASVITVTNLDADNITSGTVATARLNVNDIISTGSIIVSGDNVTDLTNNAGYVDTAGAASAAPVQSVAGATGAVSASTIITAGNIVVQGDNISDLTNDSAFIDGTQVNSNVTSISGGVITTGTINGSVVNVTNINADNISTGTLNADLIQIDNITLDTDINGNLIIKSGGVGTSQIANNAITTVLINDDAITTAKIVDDAVTNALIATDAVNQDSIAANSVTATEIVANTITASEIAASTITAAQIASNTITAGQIAANTITASQIASNTITANQIATGTLTSASGVFGIISANDITTGTLNATNVAVTNLNADNITTGSLNADLLQIDDVTIDTDGSGNLIVKSGGIDTTQIADDAVTDAKVSNLSANSITTGTLDSGLINTNTLNVKHFDDVSTDIKSHLTTETFVPLSRDGQAYVQRTSPYTGSNASFIPVTITQVRNNATYVAIFSGVLGDVSGGRVQYSLNNSTWVNASGNTNISWSAGTYRGYTYVYTGQITTLSGTQSTVYWRIYFSGSYNHTQLSLNVMMDNTQ
jgi:hypothetical protein